MNEDWHPADIKAALYKRGLTLKSLATRFGLKGSTSLSAALVRRSPHNEQRIADALGVLPEKIWPSRYTTTTYMGRKSTGMTRQDVVGFVSEYSGLNREQSACALAAIAALITGQLKQGEEAFIPDVGKFHVAKRNARTSSPSAFAPAFKPAKRLKEAVLKTPPST